MATHSPGASGDVAVPLGQLVDGAWPITQAPMGTMRPDCSASGMNSAGLTAPSVGMVPSQQGLAARPAAALDRHDRLVDQVELVALQRTTQRGVQVEAADGLVAHLLAEPLDPGPAPLLGQVHRRVGVAQQAWTALSPGSLTATPALTVTIRSVRSTSNGCPRPGR